MDETIGTPHLVSRFLGRILALAGTIIAAVILSPVILIVAGSIAVVSFVLGIVRGGVDQNPQKK